MGSSRDSARAEQVTTPPRQFDIHNPNTTLEEYMHYAALSRAMERRVDAESPPAPGFFSNMFGRGAKAASPTVLTGPTTSGETMEEADKVEKGGNELNATTTIDAGSTNLIPDEEWNMANRGLRTATWTAVFYLITTDIMGPYSVPWAMSQLGYGPGISLYVIFGALAGWSGYLLYGMFLQLDSDRYPLKTFGDIGFRVYGRVARHGINILQSLQILFNVGLIVLGNAQGLSQVTKYKVCFAVLCLIWALIGMIIGQVRTLAKLSYFTNCAVWLNLLVMFITMGVVAHSDPYYEAAIAYNGVEMGPVVTSAGLPSGTPFESQVVGLMQAVYSYGGTMLFCEFMSEMRRPWDFWKALICAQALIMIIYLTFGVFVYSFQGQFSINPAGQGIAPYIPQTIVNVLGMTATIVAGALYGNIGMKVVYQNLVREALKGPDLTEKKGKILWAVMVPIYWSFAFIIASAIPQFSNISGLVGAVCILQFTYTFPPILKLGFDIQSHAMLPDEFNPVTGELARVDSGFKRFMRGAKKQWWFKLWLLIYFLGSFATAVLGMYSSVKAIISGFETSSAVGFSCRSPFV